MPYVAGAFIIVLQLLAGAAGHILDVFFQRSQLDRKTIVGTKAVTQVAGHLYRIAYFGSFEAAFDERSPGGRMRRPSAWRSRERRWRHGARAHDRRRVSHVEPARDHQA